MAFKRLFAYYIFKGNKTELSLFSLFLIIIKNPITFEMDFINILKKKIEQN